MSKLSDFLSLDLATPLLSVNKQLTRISISFLEPSQPQSTWHQRLFSKRTNNDESKTANQFIEVFFLNIFRLLNQ